jgi:hypothetical protein
MVSNGSGDNRRSQAATDGTLPALMKLARQGLPAHHSPLVQRRLGVPFLGNLVAGQ